MQVTISIECSCHWQLSIDTAWGEWNYFIMTLFLGRGSLRDQSRFTNLRRLNKFAVSPKTVKLLQMHHWEHPVRMYHRLVWQLHSSQPQGSPEGGTVFPTHHRRKTTCPPGHLHHPMSQEGQKDNQGHQPPKPLPVHPAIIQKARSVQVHQSWDRGCKKQLLSQGHLTAKQPSLVHQRLIRNHWSLLEMDH